MKLLHPAKRSSPAVRLVLCSALALCSFVALAATARADGPYTHHVVAKDARDGGNTVSCGDLESWLSTYEGAFLSGAVYPDWGYLGGRGKDAEAAHWPPFEQALEDYLRRTLAPPYDEEEKKAVAFYLGLLSHNQADNQFHDVYLPIARSSGDLNEPGDTHYAIEWGVDALNVADDALMELVLWALGLDRSIKWHFPATALEAAYAAPGACNYPPKCTECDSPRYSADQLAEGASDYATVYGRQTGLELVTAELLRRSLPYSAEWSNRKGCDNGGMCAQAQATRARWAVLCASLQPATAVTLSPALPDGKNGWYQQPVTTRVQATSNITHGDVVTKYRLGSAPESALAGAFTVTAEGETTVTISARDTIGVAPVITQTHLNIDTVAPGVSIEAARLTRVDPIIVHGIDPMPGSGLASLSVNNMAVADGQAIDPFWLAPGANTLALRGEDVAGHLTEQAAALDIFATFDSLRATAARLCQESEISGKANCDWITATLGAAQRAANRGDRGTAVAVLNARRQQATAQAGKAITRRAAEILLGDCAYVIGDLDKR